MTLLRHLIAADLRRFGRLIAAWIALVAAGVVAYAWLPLIAGTERAAVLSLTAAILWLARQIYELVLVAQIVHAHPAVGSTAFWMTRPIPPRMLAASKAVLIGAVFVGAPVAGDTMLGIAYSVPPGDMLMSALQVALVNAVWVALCLGVAVLTRGLAQFAVVCGVAVGGLVLAPFVIELAVSTSRLGGTGPRHDVASSPVLPVLAALVILAFLVAIPFIQYTRRRRSQAVAVGAGGACLALALAWVPAPPILVRPTPPPEWAQQARLELASGASAPYTAAPYVRLVETESLGREFWHVVKADVRLPSLPPGWVASASLEEATVQSARGFVESHGQLSPAGAALLPPGDDREPPKRLALRTALDVDRLLGSQDGLQSATVFLVPGASVPQPASFGGRYHGRFRVVPTHLEAAGVLPLVVGSTFQDGAFRAVVRDLTHDALLPIRLQLSGTTTLLPGRARPRYEFYLRNRSRREAVTGAAFHGQYLPVLPGVSMLAGIAGLAPGVWTAASVRNYGGDPGLLRLRPDAGLSREWLDGAELVVVRETTGGTFDATLDIDRFTIVSMPVPRAAPPRY